jgi:hypothetical protein
MLINNYNLNLIFVSMALPNSIIVMSNAVITNQDVAAIVVKDSFNSLLYPMNRQHLNLKSMAVIWFWTATILDFLPESQVMAAITPQPHNNAQS